MTRSTGVHDADAPVPRPPALSRPRRVAAFLIGVTLAADLIGASLLARRGAHPAWEAFRAIDSPADPRQLATLQGHTDSIASLAFSPDGKLLASGSWDRTVKIWDIDTRQEVATLGGLADAVLCVAFATDGQTLAAGTAYRDNTIRIWNLDTRSVSAVYSGHAGGVRSLTFNPKSPALASGGGDSCVRFWPTDRRLPGDLVLSHAGMPVWFVQYSADGSLLFSATKWGLFKKWDARSFAEKGALRDWRRLAPAVAVCTDGPSWQVARGRPDHQIVVRDLSAGRDTAVLSGNTDAIRCLAFAPGGRGIASGGMDCSLRVWSLPDAQPRWTWLGNRSFVRAVAFSPRGNVLASAGDDRIIRLWNVRDLLP